MSERDASKEIILPSVIDEAWLEQFTEEYEGGQYEAEVKVEDWLEQPSADEGTEYRETGSGYYVLNDLMSASGWEQTIAGKVLSAAHTNVPHYHDTGFANVLALTEASVQTDGEPIPLADDGIVLVRLDRLMAPVSLKDLH